MSFHPNVAFKCHFHIIVICLMFEDPANMLTSVVKLIISGKRRLSDRWRAMIYSGMCSEGAHFFDHLALNLSRVHNTVSYNPLYIAGENPSIVYSCLSSTNSFRWVSKKTDCEAYWNSEIEFYLTCRFWATLRTLQPPTSCLVDYSDF